MERKRWPMTKIVATYKDGKGVAPSVRLLMGSVERASQKSRYLEWVVNKLVVLVEKKRQSWLFVSPSRSWNVNVFKMVASWG